MGAVSIEIDDVASLGVIRDVPPYQLPPEAWSLGENVRFEDDSISFESGYTPVFGTPTVAPYVAQFISTKSQPWWLYAGLNKAYVWDGTSHTNITRQTTGSDVNYNATGAADWNTTILGGIPILNNGIDVPQFWASYSASQKLQNLTNWPSGYVVKVLRAFGPYLMALGVTESGVIKPHLVLWSSPADPGTVPGSWDITDPTTNAGAVDLSDVDSGIILDGLPLQGKFYVYKESSTWRFRNIGGQFIFDEDAFLETIGLLATRCVAVTGDGQQHVFVSQDDFFLHNGNTATPLLEKKFKRYLFNQIDVTNFRNSFLFVNPLRFEATFCYPAQGATFPNRRLTFNYVNGNFTEGDVDFQAATLGTVESSNTLTWAAISSSWANYPDPWAVSNRRKLIACKPTAPAFEQLDSGVTRDGTSYTGIIQRTALGVIGKKRTGEWINDFEVRKLVTRIWPKITGGPVNIRLGGQNIPDGPVSWSPLTFFDPSVSKYCDIIAEGAAIAVEFSGTTAWKLNGYKLDMVTLGNL